MQKALLLATVREPSKAGPTPFSLIYCYLQERIDIVTELPEVYPYFFLKPDLESNEAASMLKKLDKRALSKHWSVYVRLNTC